ncbi:MAG: homoserine dehydrogenase [Elusimicrobiota bacterium]
MAGVSVIGLGTVGSETVRLLLEHEVELRSVCDSDPARLKRLTVPARVRRLKDFDSALRDSEIIVELIGGVGPAKKLMLKALRAGKHVVTANKHLLSRHWPEVFAAARKAGTQVRFEGAVAGCIPIIQALRTGLAANKVLSIHGILNGTTNYILSKMAHDGGSMKQALAEAQRLGMAERDPSLDLSGADTTHKLSILASLVSGAWVKPQLIPCRGIEGIESEDIRFAVDKLGRTPRLLGTARFGDGLEAHVQPAFVPLKHPLAAVHGGYNAVFVDCDPAGDLMFYGKGAGAGPAASAVVSDVLELSAGVRGPLPAAAPAAPLLPESAAPRYLKLKVKDVPGALGSITTTLGRAGVSIAQIHQSAVHNPRHWVPIMIVTHATERAPLEKALKSILSSSIVTRPFTCLRILD